ncbi:crossover junction endodeoxyribonuclease RuvC [candidate division WOR-1 bacterium RIFOXYB2_FULL_42_35]|uniref:Crossover junction endodeoxyribonuclease RuvC n=1 Tax=candidate division WOR-1 bacterium RIFOXYC2_FULL_41_25 TaxID=1802586 RepID=A0A1F4TIY3_UNCSA|nr:MAG: crossover junction endodeoxyribonuclease RuvC [candidate division WOR-1 bacterium RIFOXYA2_FULL_41_14]OGC21790.1 MAG: crossover junction endodeoxyribonuclease RuvC [candidate division WOR-1 bacterium RIFOXYB2_FULL_42_35]OGC32688.1 MAG: crossover junction endodeoxyribonuclease RuvC [candidate division WOR-1 bacterium RIFOXYC2_FULL_41_25]OGC41551.1 MAG: crossover junction endodeoxyribonuclease RuvC [candidate division WOR-1 bacterium RIFOXYD2_FULL_41_8]
MRTLGIDPGIATTGFGLVEENGQKLVFVEHGVIKTSPQQNSKDRLQKIFIEAKKIIKDFKPQAVAIEKLFFGKNAKTAMAVSQARGIMLLSAAEAGVSVTEYSPLEVKIALTGYGRAEKKQIQQMVKILLGLADVPKPDDAADALAIAICHHHSYKLKNL